MRVRTSATAALAAAGLAALPAGAAAKGFKYGVTASEVSSSSALVWTRADKTGKVTLDLSSDPKFGNGDDKHKTLTAKSSLDNTVQTTVRKLLAGHAYRYRYRQGKNTSA